MSSQRNSRCAPNPRRTNRGSAIITVLVLAAVTAVIASSFMFRSAEEARLAGRSLLQAVAINLAEAGVEEGLFAANTGTFTGANGWTLASGSTTDYVKTITGFNFQQATGTIYMRVDSATTMTPIVIAAAKVTIPNQPPLIKQIRVGAIKRRLWGSGGMISRGVITFSGNTVIDSYDSNVGPYNSATNRTDQVIVASLSTALDPVVVGSNASIYGYVATTGNDPEVGSGGRIYGATTPDGTNVDQTRIRHDFTSNLPDVSTPTTYSTGLLSSSLGAVSGSLTLPRVGDLPTANGRYVYSATSVSVAGNDSLQIMGPVDIVVTGGVSVSGNAYINVGGTGSTNPSMNLYSAGTVSISGNGMTNQTSNASKATIWGTAASTTTQSLTISGNGSFTGTIYAPNANITMSGNGDTNGAIIGKTVTVSGNGKFHYDVRLGDIDTTLDTSYRLNAWCELTGAPGSSGAFARDSRAPFNTIF